MSSTVFSDVEDYLSSNGQNLYSDDEHFRPHPRWDSDSSVSPNRPSVDEELARPRADSVRTANTSVASGSQPIKRRLRDEWDLRVIIKNTLPNGTDRIEAELKCSSAILCDSSRKLKAMIQTEGRTRRIGGGPQRNLEIITPPFSTAEAVDILICSMHHYNPYRRIESFEDLLHLAIACWSLECSTGPIENLGNISKSDLWRPRPQVLRGNNRQDYRYVGWVFVALVFGWDDVFREASREVAMGGRRAIEYDGDYLPDDLRGAIEEKRTTTIAGIISFVRQTSQNYLLSDGMFPGVICTFLRTLDERLQHFRVHLIVSETTDYGTGDVPSARELLTHLKGLPGIPSEYRGEVADPPLSPTQPIPPGLPQPPPSPSHRSHRSAESSSGGGGAPDLGDLEQWRMGSTSGALSSSVAKMWHKRRRVVDWVNTVCRPSRIDVINGRPVTQQESAGAQEWERVRAEFLARLEDEVEGLGAMELEDFRELRERHILQPVSGRY